MRVRAKAISCLMSAMGNDYAFRYLCLVIVFSSLIYYTNIGGILKPFPSPRDQLTDGAATKSNRNSNGQHDRSLSLEEGSITIEEESAPSDQTYVTQNPNVSKVSSTILFGKF